MPIYCHFLYKSEYQFEKKIDQTALCKNVPPPSFSMILPRCRQGGLREKATRVLLRRKVMLGYDTNRFLDSFMFFEIFR